MVSTDFGFQMPLDQIRHLVCFVERGDRDCQYSHVLHVVWIVSQQSVEVMQRFACVAFCCSNFGPCMIADAGDIWHCWGPMHSPA